MPATPTPPPPPSRKYYFYYGHRRPSQNRPIVHGGHFTNRRSLPSTPPPSPTPMPSVDFRDWDPSHPSSPPPTTPPALPAPDRRLSPLARFLLDTLRRHNLRWSPALLSDLQKLRRVSPSLLTEVLRHSHPPLPPALSSRLFHWAHRQKSFRPSFANFNALAYSLNSANLPHAADRVPDLMSNLGKPPTEKQLEILVRFHADAGRGLRLFHVYQRMRSEFGVKPRTFLYNRILDSLVRTGHLDLALQVYDDMRSDGVKEEAITFTILAKGFCRAGKIDEAVEILERMRSELCKPDIFAYTAMVKVLVSEGNLDGGLRVWEEMRRDGVEPDVMAYSTMVSGLCKVGRVDKGCELFREMKRKKFLIDRAVYGALVEGFVGVGSVAEGCGLLKEMVKDGYRPDLGIYNSLIRGLCAAKRTDKGYKLFWIVVSEGLVPSFDTVTPLLVSFADLDEMDRFFMLVERMGELGLPTLDHLADFFTSFIMTGEREFKAVEVFEALKGKGYCTITFYNILIEGLHKIKEGKRAILLFDELKGLKDLEPDSCTYSLVIPCYVDDGNVLEACSCYNKVKEKGWTPSIAAYCSLVKGLCKIGEINAALTLVRDCLGNVTDGPMEFKYTLTILNACRSKKPEKVIETLDEMIELGYPLEDIIYCAVIHGFCKHASSGEARVVLAVMKNRKLLSEANFIVYEEMLNEHLEKMTAGLILSGLKFFGLEKKLKLTSSLD